MTSDKVNITSVKFEQIGHRVLVGYAPLLPSRRVAATLTLLYEALMNYPKLRWTCLPLTLLVPTACFGGRVATDDGYLDQAKVEVKNCPNCTVAEDQTNDLGIYVFDGYAGDPFIEHRDGAEAVRITVSKPGYQTRTVYHRVEYEGEDGALADRRDVFLYPVGSVDTDGDGLTDAEEAKIGTSPDRADTDGDSLPDGWEVNGHDFIDLQALGANPRQPDVFVECDYTAGQKPDPQQLKRVVDAFDEGGVTLHIDIDEQLGDEYAVFVSKYGPDIQDDLREARADHMSAARRSIFHYCVFAEGDLGVGGWGGISAGIPGGVFGVFVEWQKDHFGLEQDVLEKVRVATFMHELGHNLGLGHGGGDGFNNKPNHLSIMNYSFLQPSKYRMRTDYRWADWEPGLVSADNPTGALDFAGVVLEPLDENGLDENKGLIAELERPMNQIWLNGRRTFYFPVFDPVMVLNAMAPIDWNFNGRTDEHPVRHDVNGDNRFDVLSVINEWEALDFSGDGIGTETMYYRIEPTMSSAKNCTPLH